MPAWFLTAALLLTSGTGREPVVLDRLEGDWQIQSWVQDGFNRMAVPMAAGLPDRWEFRRGIMTIYSGEQVLVTDLKIVINETADPKTFSISYVGKDPALKVRYQNGVRGICRFEGDTWIRCYHTDWRQMPEKFESPVGAGFILQTMKRVPARKPKTPAAGK